MLHLQDNRTGMQYPEMTNEERVAASTADRDLHWSGPNVVAASGRLTDGVHPSGRVEMFAPDPQQPGSSVSHFNTTLEPSELMEPILPQARHDVGLAAELFQADSSRREFLERVAQGAEIKVGLQIAPTTNDLIFLKQNGVSDAVIGAYQSCRMQRLTVPLEPSFRGPAVVPVEYYGPTYCPVPRVVPVHPRRIPHRHLPRGGFGINIDL